jgi:hypothetical protein
MSSQSFQNRLDIDNHTYIIGGEVKEKENFTVEQVTKTQRGSRGIALLFL